MFQEGRLSGKAEENFTALPKLVARATLQRENDYREQFYRVCCRKYSKTKYMTISCCDESTITLSFIYLS